MNLIKLTLHD